MKTIRHISAVFSALSAFALSSIAQDLAPASVAGRTAVVIITSGTGLFASTGGYRLVLTATGYQIVPVTSTVLPSSGTYTWSKTGANSATTVIVNAQTGVAATQSIVFSSPTVGTFSTSSIVGAQSGSFIWEGVSDVNRFVNISTRGSVGTDSNILIGGLVVSGTVPKRILIRGVGPALSAFGVSGALLDPVLTVISSSGAIVGQNDDWAPAQIGTAFPQVGAFLFTAGSRDAAIILTLPAGSYTAQVSGKNSTTGVALIEIYELP